MAANGSQQIYLHDEDNATETADEAKTPDAFVPVSKETHEALKET